MPQVTPALLLAIAPYVVPIIVALCAALYKGAIGRLPANVRDEVAGLVHQCVVAVEQTSPGVPGAQKKQAAVALIGHILALAHLSVPAALIDVFIESSVALLNDGQPPHLASAPVGFAAPSGMHAPDSRS